MTNCCNVQFSIFRIFYYCYFTCITIPTTKYFSLEYRGKEENHRLTNHSPSGIWRPDWCWSVKYSARLHRTAVRINCCHPGICIHSCITISRKKTISTEISSFTFYSPLGSSDGAAEIIRSWFAGIHIWLADNWFVVKTDLSTNKIVVQAKSYKASITLTRQFRVAICCAVRVRHN